MSERVPDERKADEQPGDALPQRRATISQVVAYNLAWYRKKAGLTQEEMGQRLGGWSAASVSAAERSWDGKRIRQFDADEIVAIAAVLGVPAVAMLLPPPDAGTAAEYIFTMGSIPLPPADTAALLAHALPEYVAAEPAPAMMRAFHERVMALGASRLLVTVADEVLRRARDEADKILQRAGQQATGLTVDARTRAEELERDALERHRLAMGGLVGQREQLERRVDDLRAFDRDYRQRLRRVLTDTRDEVYAFVMYKLNQLGPEEGESE